MRTRIIIVTALSIARCYAPGQKTHTSARENHSGTSFGHQFSSVTIGPVFEMMKPATPIQTNENARSSFCFRRILMEFPRMENVLKNANPRTDLRTARRLIWPALFGLLLLSITFVAVPVFLIQPFRPADPTGT